MSTYVSQLRQQTGIILSSDSQQVGENLADIFSAESSTEPIPFIEEHHQVEVSQPTHSASPMVQGQPEPVREQTASISETPKDNSSEHQVSSAPEALTGSLMPRSDRVTSEVAPTLIVEQHEIQIADASFPPSHQNQPKETTSSAIPPEVNESPKVESVTTQQAVNAPMTAQTYLRAVRDWVAGTPADQEEILEVPVETIPSKSPPKNATKPIIHEEILEVPVKEATPSQLPQDTTKPIVDRHDRTYLLMQERISRSQTQQPKVEQDFTLSIGSIQLTVTAPPPETKPPPIVPDRVAPTSYAEPFRLSRHYLRFR